MIQSLVSWWIYKRRFGKTVSGTKWPLHQLWAGNEALYMRCQEAVRAIQRSCANLLETEWIEWRTQVCVARIRSLRVLFAEVKKRRPEGYDREGGTSENQAKKEAKRKRKAERKAAKAAKGLRNGSVWGPIGPPTSPRDAFQTLLRHACGPILTSG